MTGLEHVNQVSLYWLACTKNYAKANKPPRKLSALAACVFQSSLNAITPMMIPKAKKMADWSSQKAPTGQRRRAT